MRRIRHFPPPYSPPVTGNYVPVFIVLCTVMWPLGAVNLTELQINEVEGVYHIRMTSMVNAPAQYVRDVLTDYVHIYRLNPAITESGILGFKDNEVTRVRTRMKGCISFFCRSVERIEDVQILPSGELLAITVPELSDFKSGSALWMIKAAGDRSQVTYLAKVEPDFFIPPIIGSYFVSKTLRNELLTSIGRIECIARINVYRDRTTRQYLTYEPPDETERDAAREAASTGRDPAATLEAPAAGSNIAMRSGDCDDT